MRVVFSTVFGLLVAGCEPYVVDEKVDAIKTTPEAAIEAPTNAPSVVVAGPTNTPSVVVAAPNNTVSTVLNDDAGCELVVKYQHRNIVNEGQVRYANRVLTSNPFGSANPVCVQYNDTQSGEVTVWKDSSSRGQRVDRLPSDRGINKIVVWYE